MAEALDSLKAQIDPNHNQDKDQDQDQALSRCSSPTQNRAGKTHRWTRGKMSTVIHYYKQLLTKLPLGLEKGIAALFLCFLPYLSKLQWCSDQHSLTARFKSTLYILCLQI